MSASGARQPDWPDLADCTRCPRLAAALAEVRIRLEGYHARPVAAFGDPAPTLLIVGLAPGMHGANRTGRPFTGDYAGELLYRTLHAFGWSSDPVSRDRADGLILRGVRITNAVKCWPPENKPLPEEIRTCNRFLAEELAAIPSGTAVLALGRIAHDAVLKALGLRGRDHPFAHAAAHALPGHSRLFDSYHCSRYNTQTRRLTDEMFESVFEDIQTWLGRAPR